LPIDVGPPVWREHERDLIEREGGGSFPIAISASRSSTLESNMRR
jgi:hypothetical protein